MPARGQTDYGRYNRDDEIAGCIVRRDAEEPCGENTRKGQCTGQPGSSANGNEAGPRPKTIRRMSDRVAPSATRTAISAVRWPTICDTTAKMPAPASKSAVAENAVINSTTTDAARRVSRKSPTPSSRFQPAARDRQSGKRRPRSQPTKREADGLNHLVSLPYRFSTSVAFELLCFFRVSLLVAVVR